jgi:hypothetical protein
MSPLNSIILVLQRAEQDVFDLLVDEQDACEDRGEFSPGFFTGDNDDIPVCVPEDASQELDGARTLIREALELLEQWYELELGRKKL